MKKLKKKKVTNLNIFLTYNLVTMIVGLVFYPLFLIILNYPPGSINTKFDIEILHIPYYQQYIIINLLMMTIGYIFFKMVFKGADKWKYIKQGLDSNNIANIKKIRQKSFNMPHIVYLLQILIPTMFVWVLFLVLGFWGTVDIKFFLILITFLILAAAISYLFSKKYFREVLKFTCIDNSVKGTIRIGLRLKIILQILPLFLFSILFTSLFGQSCLIKEKGDTIFNSYKHELDSELKNTTFIQSEAQIKRFFNLIKMDNKNDIMFYINPLGKYKTQDNSPLNKFFLKYTRELAFKYNGHTYDYYGSDVQGAVIKLHGIKGDWILGIRYVVVSQKILTLLILSFIAQFLVAIFILLYFAKTISDDLTLIASGMMEIAEGEDVNLNNRIAVTSNDEIADLVIGFNKFQEREKKHIQDINEQQKIIMERERLASLGQMIGGIVHNLRTPILSIVDVSEVLKNLVAEYRESIDDERVTKEDHREIANEMEIRLNEIKPHCSYMSDVLATVKGQTVQVNTLLSSDSSVFTMKELFKRVEILTRYELIKFGCVITYDIKVDSDIEIAGEISNLVQVLNNLISNSVQAYEGKGGIIEFSVSQKDALLEFCICDTGTGIPSEIQHKLFKEMVTTKGKMGTGLGLYVSYAIIKGKFSGDLWFESVIGKGTSFFISIPAK